MAAEYTAALVQIVAENENVIFTDTPIPCGKGYVTHRDNSGVFRLRGLTDKCYARYSINFNGNIAVPTGGTVGEISVAIAVDSEPLATSKAIVTPAAVEEFFNVSAFAIIDVPRGCCAVVTIKNITDETAGEISVQNANLTIDRIA